MSTAADMAAGSVAAAVPDADVDVDESLLDGCEVAVDECLSEDLASPLIADNFSTSWRRPV